MKVNSSISIFWKIFFLPQRHEATKKSRRGKKINFVNLRVLEAYWQFCYFHEVTKFTMEPLKNNYYETCSILD
jgi:hypothetical protein